MMKMTKYISRLASVTVLSVLFFVGQPKAAAQEECYTLTNGRVHWYEHDSWVVDPSTQKPVYQTERSFNHITAGDSWNELHHYSQDYIYDITEAGNTYARLDLSGATPTLTESNTLDLYCVWHRTGQTGYYFQEHNGTIYYLIGGKDGFEIVPVSANQATDKLSLWYNWDFGAAVKEVIYTDGSRKERYYWLMLDSVSHQWTMSAHSYERPETVIYTDYDFANDQAAQAWNSAHKEWYQTREIGGIKHGAGIGAQVSPIIVTEHDKALHNVPPQYGIQSVKLMDGMIEKTVMGIGDKFDIATAVNQVMSPSADIQVTPAYTHYKEEIYRYGIHTNYRERTAEEFGSAGVATYRNYYYYNGSLHHSANYDETAIPESEASDLVVSQVTYSLSPSAYRYLHFIYPTSPETELVDPAALTITSAQVADPTTAQVKLYCFDVPPVNSRPKLIVTVTYTNGVRQTEEIEIEMSSDYTRQPMPTATNAPVIHGAVFGGGRMANVAGNTNITIHNADSIYAVYGGNDIAGWVQGDNGATIQIGTEKTVASAPVHIGWVYGGGCGYYSYRGITFSASHGYPYRPGTKRFGINYQNYYFGNEHHEGYVYPWGTVPTWNGAGEMPENITPADTGDLSWPTQYIAKGFHYIPVSHDPEHVDHSETGDGGNGTIPYIKTSHITVGIHGDGAEVHNDYIVIDSLYGGAENAFIGVESFEETPANAITMDINGGTIFTVFGGNNYGGAVANTSTVMITVDNTKLPPVATGTGAGTSTVSGNPILEATSDASHFHGFGRDYGIRYLFGGGNMVDGSHAYVEINGGVLDTVFGGGNSATVSLPVVRVNCTGSNFICDNESYNQSNPNFGVDNWTGEVGNYNIRTLFGGNNKADMQTLSYVQLASGGVSSVYGGGNMGDMLNEAVISRPELRTLMAQTLADANIPAPVAVGSIVYTPPTSGIVCDYVFGGCRMANVLHSSGCVLYGGTFGYVNGGNDISGDVGSTIATTLDNPSSPTRGNRDGAYVFLSGDVTVVADAVGGSDGYYHCDSIGVYYKDDDIFDTYDGKNYDPYHEFVGMALPTHNNTYMAMFKSSLYPSLTPRVFGDVISGGVHSNVGFDENVPYKVVPADDIKNGSTHLSLLGGTVEGNVFGGGYMSSIYGLGYLHVGGTVTINGSLFAGNDLLGAVTPFGGYTLTGVNNEAAYMAAVTSDGTNLNVKEGSSWNPAYSCYLLIDGTPSIRAVYGGGNGAYNYDDEHPEYGARPSLCIGTNGGINRPLQSSSYIDINVEGGRIDTVFGGGNGIGVESNVTVLLNSQNNSGEYVGIIFGGNNRDDMTTCVPNIILKNGQVKDVYGGGNSGSMKGSAEFRDACNNLITGISTHILIDESTNAQINGSIYGGCRMADVTGMSYVEIRGSEVNTVYGGNDIAGTVSGNTRIDISGGTVHNIFGGSNGKYDYEYLSEGSGTEISHYYKIYKFESDHTNPANIITNHNATGRPFVDSTTVNLYGGTITTDVYGGGNLGDCRLTLVEVNDQVCPGTLTANLDINGAIYGGGKGIDNNLNAERQGNVLTPENDDRPSRTHVNLRHAHRLESTDGKVKAYGGGRGGDVMDTYITAFDTWGTPFDEIYGGCWGSDVRGITHVIMDGSTSDPTAMTAQNVYGGNDFTGAAYETEITINSGNYGNVFGGGNGDYEADKYYSGVYSNNYTAADLVHNPNVVVGQPRRIYEPNNEYAVINYNNGTVTGNLYGGGRQGTTMRYKRDNDGRWLTVAGGASKQPDTLQSLNTANLPYTDAERYSHIIINVKNGTFDHNIYAGGMGKDGGNWIVYGLKEVNIEDGLVKESVYGGSENVSDGYASECVATDNTTERPSSIVNITGGTIKNNVYGGGYLGTVHGSAYVNVGIEAVNNCSLWTKNVNGVENAYALFRPGGYTVNGNDTTWGHSPAMTANPLQLQASIYGGANWGDNVGSADFSKQGFFGGESRIMVDGEGYNSYNDAAHESLPLINIVHSIIGSGTSAEGGDRYSRVDVRNYGAINPSTCKPTRALHAIQRTDGLWLENTAIDYTGATDAISAYLSQQFTINRVDTLNCVGYNVVDIDATMTNVSVVNFLYNKAYTNYLANHYASATPAVQVNDSWYEPSHQYMYTLNGLMINGSNCTPGLSLCDEMLGIMDRNDSSMSIPALVINNGINVDIIGEDGAYGTINGYGLMVAQTGTSAIVTARAKFETYNDGTAHDGHEDDGGFVTTCNNELQSIQSISNHYDITWCDCFDEGNPVTTNDEYCNYDGRTWNESKAEYPYSNYGNVYRVWKLGEGKRRRFAVIQAHSNPDKLYSLIDPEGDDVPSNRAYDNKKVTLRYEEGGAHDSLYNFSIAYSKLVLPPTTPGNFYKITAAGVVIDDENQEMRLTDVSYKPTSWEGSNKIDNEWKLDNTTARLTNGSDAEGVTYEDADHGQWRELTLSSAGTLTGANHIYNYTGGKQYFGLMMSSGKNFSGDAPPASAHIASWQDGTTISGNAHTNMVSNFATSTVSTTVNASPELDLYLLYDNRFSHTIVGTINFTLQEYNADSDQPIPNSEIEIEITITTILQDFTTMDYEVLAMYNEGRSDKFSRKVILPATLQQRELYLESLSWFPTKIEGGIANGDTLHNSTVTVAGTPKEPDWFYLTDKTSDIKNQPANEHSYFGMTIMPTENVSNTLVTAISWHSISITEPLDLFTAAYGIGNTESPWRAYTDSYYQESGETPAHTIGKKMLTDDGDHTHGIKIGNLDGRGEAAINVVLNYDGSRVYGDYSGKGYVGKVVLGLVSYTGGDYNNPNRFDIIINVKTRAHGDTIYLASPDYFDEEFNSTPNTIHTVVDNPAGIEDYYVRKCDWDNDGDDAGKRPHSCATSFYDALTKVYQEGDVIAIIGPVTIEDEQTLIKGNEYMPIPVIRYEGHHRDMPGEQCVYRGPMVTITGPNTTFAARCIEFKGSMVSKIVPENAANPGTEWTTAHPLSYNPMDDSDIKYVDTNKVYGPILRVMNDATLTLQHGVIVEQNNNAYAGDDPSLYGAISVTDNGRLNVLNSVNIRHNICNSTSTNWDIHPETGAVHVDGGLMYIAPSNSITAIHIDSNYLVDASAPYWLSHSRDFGAPIGTKLLHYDFNVDSYYPENTDHKLANVYLTRTEPTTVPSEIIALGAAAVQAYKDTHDVKSSRIEFDEVIAEGTRIGVSKWFPDQNEELRDTIQIAFQADATYMLDAEVNKNFVSDNRNYFTFYNYGVNNQRMFLARCATFKYQAPNLDGSGDPIEYITGSRIYTDSAIYYRPLSGASCPIGGDSIIVRAQGGFFPYTYTWSNPGDNFNDPTDDEVIRTYKSPNTNNEVNHQIALSTPNYKPMAIAMADTLYTANVDMPYSESSRTVRYLVTTSDATGHCTLTKKVAVTLVKGDGTHGPMELDNADVWAAQDAPNTVNASSCTGNRNYHAVQITPMVWSPGYGAIAVTSNKNPNVYIINNSTETEVTGLSFCEGDVLTLYASPKFHMENVLDEHGDPVLDGESNPIQTKAYEANFMMWDFDPYYSNPTAYVVPTSDRTVTAYFSPMKYWIDTVTSTTLARAYYDENFTYTDANYPTGAGMVTTYNGDVHIYNEEGLAWLISCVNGFNGTQARTFHFNRVYIHEKSGGYDMKKYLWTPMGTAQHPFEGMLIGVSGGAANTAPWSGISGTDTTWSTPVLIKNIVVDEPNLDNAGFFAFMDSARIINIELQGAIVRGAQNVGTLAARSSNSRLRRVNVSSNIDGTTTTILSTHYLSGGVLGLSDNDTIKDGSIAAKFVGDAVYSGGVVGYGTSTKAVNNSGYNDNRMRGLYLGGMAGYLNGTSPVSSGLFRRKSQGNPSRFENNYFRVTTNGATQRVGGVVGYAENSVIANNYIYGDLETSGTKGGVTALASDGTKVNHNYYESSAAKLPTGSERCNAEIADVSAFEGQGNRVTIMEPVYGVDNLTRVLNKWVREHNAAGGDYKTWRSDLADLNNGYPVFGNPDTIPVESTMRIDACEEQEWEGRIYTADVTLTTNTIDPIEMIDSTTIVNIYIHHGTVTELADSALVEEGYEGYGFTVSPTEAMLLNQTILENGSAQMVLSDTLSTVFGCDSVITLTLTFTGGVGIPEVEIEPTTSVKVYPNPTVGEVNVEAEQMSHVELYDNEGRRMADYDTHDSNHLNLNLHSLASGIYYLRIHTPTAVTIHKIVKR